MARITLTLEVTDEQQAALVQRFINEARPYVDEDVAAPGAVPGALDSRGVPWHADFHAASMTKTQAGEWKKRKGGDKDAIEAYERQFTAPQPGPIVETVEIPAFMQRQPAPATPVAAPAMPPMPAPVPAAMPMPPVPTAAAPVSYDEMIAVFNEVGARIGAERVSAETLRIYGVIGITDPNVLTTDETMRAKLVAQLRAIQ